MVSVMCLNMTGLLAELSGTDPSAWEEVEGPDSGCGLDYWYHHPEEGEAHINVDQTLLTISIRGGRSYRGDYQDDEWLSRYVVEE